MTVLKTETETAVFSLNTDRNRPSSDDPEPLQHYKTYIKTQVYFKNRRSLEYGWFAVICSDLRFSWSDLRITLCWSAVICSNLQFSGRPAGEASQLVTRSTCHSDFLVPSWPLCFWGHVTSWPFCFRRWVTSWFMDVSPLCQFAAWTFGPQTFCRLDVSPPHYGRFAPLCNRLMPPGSLCRHTDRWSASCCWCQLRFKLVLTLARYQSFYITFT